MRKSDLQPLSGLMGRYTPKALQIALRLAEMEREWSSIVGGALAARSQPVSFDRSGLVVACTTPAAAQMVEWSSKSILATLRRRWALEFVGIRAVVVSRLKIRRHPTPSVIRQVRPDERTVRTFYDKTSSQIEQSDVALALARLRATYVKRFGGSGTDGTGKENTP